MVRDSLVLSKSALGGRMHAGKRRGALAGHTRSLGRARILARTERV